MLAPVLVPPTRGGLGLAPGSAGSAGANAAQLAAAAGATPMMQAAAAQAAMAQSAAAQAQAAQNATQGSFGKPPGGSAPPIFGSAATFATTIGATSNFAALAGPSGSSSGGKNGSKTSKDDVRNAAKALLANAISPPGTSAQAAANKKEEEKNAENDGSNDINSLKKKLATMERETARLREMHQIRLKKLEAKQRAQDELMKRDAEIQRRQDEEDARTVYVRNLHPSLNQQHIREHFSMFGEIKRIVLPQDAHLPGSNRGFTFITFASKEPVEVACSLDGTLFHERAIKVVPKTNMMGKIRPQHLV
jgi:hypothetical protein